MGLTETQMLGLIQRSLPDIEADPIKHEVHAVIGLYWFALVSTRHKGLYHRFMCWTGDKNEVARAERFIKAEKDAKAVLAKSQYHREVLEQIVRDQPSHLAKQHNFLSLLQGSLNS